MGLLDKKVVLITGTAGAGKAQRLSDATSTLKPTMRRTTSYAAPTVR
jgi:predicted ATP-dependent serine protease